MSFQIDFTVDVGGGPVPSQRVLEQPSDYREALAKIGVGIEGSLILSFGNRCAAPDFVEPLVRLADGWLRKLRWLLGGDTETLALRNSEECFALIPTGGAVEISFFQGDESEIDQYIIDPTTVRMDDFASASIAMGRRLLEVLKAIDATLLTRSEDCKDLQASVDDAESAWHDHKAHQRR
jgi:hypothetical protein